MKVSYWFVHLILFATGYIIMTKSVYHNQLYDNFFAEMSTGLGLSALPRDKAWIICRNYLQGAWTNLDKHEMILKQVT